MRVGSWLSDSWILREGGWTGRRLRDNLEVGWRKGEGSRGARAGAVGAHGGTGACWAEWRGSARDSRERGLARVPLGAAELNYLQTRCKVEGAWGGVVGEEGRGRQELGPERRVDLGLGTWVEERYVGGERLAKSIHVNDLLKEEEHFRICFFGFLQCWDRARLGR